MNKLLLLTTSAVLISLAAMTSSALAQDAPAPSLGRFPAIEGSNLEGRRFALPGDFEGTLNVVMVAFKREHQRDVDTWLPFLKTLTASRADLRVYEIPTLGRRYRVMRSFIDGGMRSGIPDKAVREATITLYIDKSPFRDALAIDTEDRIHVLLVDQQGMVHWRAEGAFESGAGARLQERLSQKERTSTPVTGSSPLR